MSAISTSTTPRARFHRAIILNKGNKETPNTTGHPGNALCVASHPFLPLRRCRGAGSRFIGRPPRWQSSALLAV